MRLPTRTHPTTDLPGTSGALRTGRQAAAVAARLRPGDVAVIDHVDLDRNAARALVDAGAVAVLNAQPMISGRFPNLGPEELTAAGVPMVDALGTDGLAALTDGRTVRVHDGRVYAEGPDGAVLAAGRALDDETIAAELAAARSGLVTQLESLTRTSTELLRREQDLLLHGQGIPRTATRFAGRSTMVVVGGPELRAELDAVRPYLREQEPVLVAVGRAADELHARGRRPDVVVVDGADEADRPSVAVLKAARDVVVRVDPGRPSGAESLERLGVRPLVFTTSATAEDAALLLVDAGDAALVVGVGLHASLEDFLDRGRGGLASTYLTRLRLGARLVDASAVPRLYSGRVRPVHLLLVMLAGLLALLAAVSVTPVGQEWIDQLADVLGLGGAL
ncbi:putative cytokinetic ring protein SteA [Nocardioides dongkuii]|uniref:putative cytokinetic ring protein SteA n=1 Tax=Nocardioides dongkuii TaxID=2760089 RepID=UPI001877CF79|nr:putative cytokinetic ring protein SteA [Nocardioides dongkuii]